MTGTIRSPTGSVAGRSAPAPTGPAAAGATGISTAVTASTAAPKLAVAILLIDMRSPSVSTEPDGPRLGEEAR
ncbi:hypothetical protein Vau01_059410 [Virgisporangium aurantiacum]|uniref:Uncharacterized protein n=1 Tax=Virgisporangium aurantiacum TaxID=175570 RepID=A0A8J3ZAX3_9ACTN|nr:hypothetical protein Vau01_059410 [Virgisporangium aurantiacum]